MKKVCGTCAFWIYKGFDDSYSDEEGDCTRLCSKTRQDEVCDEHIFHPVLLEEERCLN